MSTELVSPTLYFAHFLT